MTLSYGALPLLLSWPLESHVGPSIGSLRQQALDAGTGMGGVLRLVFNRRDRNVTVEAVSRAIGHESPHAPSLD